MEGSGIKVGVEAYPQETFGIVGPLRLIFNCIFTRLIFKVVFKILRRPAWGGASSLIARLLPRSSLGKRL